GGQPAGIAAGAARPQRRRARVPNGGPPVPARDLAGTRTEPPGAATHADSVARAHAHRDAIPVEHKIGSIMPRVLLVIGDATEVLDTMYPFFRLPEDGFDVVVAAPERRLYHMVLHERPPGWDITQETAGYHLQSDIAFADVKPEDYTGLFLSGGRAPEYL